MFAALYYAILDLKCLLEYSFPVLIFVQDFLMVLIHDFPPLRDSSIQYILARKPSSNIVQQNVAGWGRIA